MYYDTNYESIKPNLSKVVPDFKKFTDRKEILL